MSTGPLGGAVFLVEGAPGLLCLLWAVALVLGAAVLDDVDLIKLFFPIKTPLSVAAIEV